MAEVTWSPSGRRDLVNVITYIASMSDLYAQRFVAQVDVAIQRLEEHPSMGHPVPELGLKDLRQIIIGNYRFIYWVHGGAVHIIRVWHSARLLRLVHVKS